MPQSNPRAILALSHLTFHFGREVLLGLAHYVRGRGDLLLQTVDMSAQSFNLSRLVETFDVKAVVGQVTRASLAEELKALWVPVVNFSTTGGGFGLPTITVDDVALGRMAGEHLLERGYRRLGFLGQPAVSSERRQEGIEAAARAGGIGVDVHRRAGDDEDLAWLDRLESPVGLIGFGDHDALRLSELVRSLGRRIPEDVAIVGLENDPVLCETAYVNISSVDIPARRIGQACGELAARLIDDPDQPIVHRLIPPLGVVVRQTSDHYAVTDPVLQEALRMMREQASGPITIDDVADACAASRRQLEQKFRKSLGTTPFKELTRLRLSRGRDLLVNTDMKIAQVAEACGFVHTARFHVAFRNATGLSPGAFRRQSRNT